MIIAKRRKLQEVKAKFSQVVDEVLASGPQVVTRHGKDTIVMMSSKEFDQLVPKRESLMDFIRRSPKIDIEFERDNSPMREIDL